MVVEFKEVVVVFVLVFLLDVCISLLWELEFILLSFKSMLFVCVWVFWILVFSSNTLLLHVCVLTMLFSVLVVVSFVAAAVLIVRSIRRTSIIGNIFKTLFLLILSPL